MNDHAVWILHESPDHLCGPCHRRAVDDPVVSAPAKIADLFSYHLTHLVERGDRSHLPHAENSNFLLHDNWRHVGTPNATDVRDGDGTPAQVLRGVLPRVLFRRCRSSEISEKLISSAYRKCGMAKDFVMALNI